MHTSDQILKLVNDTLDNLAYDRKPASLYEPIRYVLSLGGKRIRPVLMLLAYNLFKDAPESIIMPACGLATYHNYTLLHDDLMDNADLRRGHETVLRRKQADRGVFITTSSFTSDAREAAKQLNIALVDGEMLTNLMIQYKVGVQVSQTYELYDIDDDFFEE